MKRPLSNRRPIGPFAESIIGSADPDPEGSMVIARIDVTGQSDDSSGTVNSGFQENMVNVVADAVSEGSQARSGAVGAIPVNMEEAVMFQPFPVSVGQEFQKAILAMMYEDNLIGKEPQIERNVEARTDRVERFDIIPV